MMGNKYKVIGIMSGTSLDGLDIAFCEFKKGKIWEYKIIRAKTIKYSRVWKYKLSHAFNASKAERLKLDNEFGKFIGYEVQRFRKNYNASVDFIASHGHTIFHQPHKGITLQIGSGEQIASVCHLPVVYDFRTGDVALGGQGAPLVPLVDKLLFSKYTYCLNLGGFANTSFDNSQGKRIAFDISPVNIVLNELAGKLGKEFDKGGKLASKGNVHIELLKKLNAIPFYKIKPPKSLGREWVEKNISPLLDSTNISVQDKLSTFVEHVAIQIASSVNRSSKKSRATILVTGGGAYNKYLMNRISFYSQPKIVMPTDKTIQFKEAMAFAFLGVLKMRGEKNILKSVTGAKRDSSGGKICFPN